MSSITDVIVRCIHGGMQTCVFFSNGFGVSIVRHKFSYGFDSGLFEVAVLCGDSKDWEICYTTDITNDVLGYQSEQDVADIMTKVREL